MTESSQNILKRQSQLPGILGGLGPLAHIEFERRLLQHSSDRGACCDQDHPNWLLINATSTPDRTQCLLSMSSDCVPSLIRSARLLEAMGADFLVVTCNTAHAFYQSVQSQVNIPWLHMMNATANYIAQNFPAAKRIGVLATDGTLQSQLYSSSLAEQGLFPILPTVGSPIQQRVMQAIYNAEWGIKASGVWVPDFALEELAVAVEWLVYQGAELVIAGCTEISLGLAKLRQLPIRLIDPLDVMANLTLDLAYPSHLVQPAILA